jgi:hypothetical protein
MGIDAQATLKTMFQDGKVVPMSDNFVFSMTFHTPESAKLAKIAKTLRQKLFEKCRLTANSDISNDALLTKSKLESYGRIKRLWNVKDATNKAKVVGQTYDDVEYKEFKPAESNTKYAGRHTRGTMKKWDGKHFESFMYSSKWRSRRQVYADFEDLINKTTREDSSPIVSLLDMTERLVQKYEGPARRSSCTF